LKTQESFKKCREDPDTDRDDSPAWSRARYQPALLSWHYGK